ncbi:hypothetical protein CCH79_00020258 [Gambusia affinis]|uniref:Uncharacterized protein n=1 Tax=Gambusia affinis TaxID=33528 RepID=A0A315WFG6_GAMAF|nr:hypothetical protein CCH79_00020258 [Gambusia affinis]
MLDDFLEAELQEEQQLLKETEAQFQGVDSGSFLSNPPSRPQSPDLIFIRLNRRRLGFLLKNQSLGRTVPRRLEVVGREPLILQLLEENRAQQQGEVCVFATFDALGKWEDWRCDVKKTFICSSTAVFQKVVSVKLEKTSGLDLNSAAVMEELLTQLLLKLKQEGLDADVQLSWRKQSDGNVFHKLKEKNPTSV